MFTALLEFVETLLTGMVRRGHESEPASEDDEDACPACDHPFGNSRHMCVGTGAGIAS